MPTLYVTKTSCGAASYWAQHIAGLNLKTVIVDLPTHKTVDGTDFYTINPKGNVPTLVFEDGVILNEGAAVLQWIADQAPNSGLAPPCGTIARYQLINNLNFIASEFHPAIGSNFFPSEGAVKEFKVNRANSYLEKIEKGFVPQKFFGGDHLNVADLYFYVVLTWTPHLGFKVGEKAAAFMARVEANEHFKAAQASLQSL